MKYTINAKVIVSCQTEVEANNIDEAIEKAKEQDKA